MKTLLMAPIQLVIVVQQRVTPLNSIYISRKGLARSSYMLYYLKWFASITGRCNITSGELTVGEMILYALLW